MSPEPRHFQIDSLVPIDDSYRSWVNEIHCELEKALAIGLTIEEIRLFGIERGLPEMGVTIRNRVDYLETLGRVNRSKKNGKLLFRMAGEANPETVMERTDAT